MYFYNLVTNNQKFKFLDAIYNSTKNITYLRLNIVKCQPFPNQSIDSKCNLNQNPSNVFSRN